MLLAMSPQSQSTGILAIIIVDGNFRDCDINQHSIKVICTRALKYRKLWLLSTSCYYKRICILLDAHFLLIAIVYYPVREECGGCSMCACECVCVHYQLHNWFNYTLKTRCR